MKEQIPGTPLVAEGDWESEWKVSANLGELKELVGMPLLVQFCRCSVAGDRLTSLGDFGFFNEEWTPRLEIPHSRNLQTMFWFTAGTLHEAIDALDDMKLLGIEGLLGSVKARRPWLELRSLIARWEEDPIFQRVRNKIAFHLDSAAIRKGINKPGREAEPVIWAKGNSKKARSTTFMFAEDCLVSLLFPTELSEEEARKRFGAFAEKVRDAHLSFSHWVQELFTAALRGASIGLKLMPLEGPRWEGLSRERHDEIAEITAQASDEIIRQALADLVGEVRRLSKVARRSDGNADAGQRRRTDEEQRLRAVAATAKEFLESRAPPAEKRLRELLRLPAEG